MRWEGATSSASSPPEPPRGFWGGGVGFLRPDGVWRGLGKCGLPAPEMCLWGNLGREAA